MAKKKARKTRKPRKSRKPSKISLSGIVKAIETVVKEIDVAVKHAPQELCSELEPKKGQLQEILALVAPICRGASLTIFPGR